MSSFRLLAADDAGPDVVSHHSSYHIQRVQEDPGQAPEGHIREPGGSGPETARLWLQRSLLTGGESILFPSKNLTGN